MCKKPPMLELKSNHVFIMIILGIFLINCHYDLMNQVKESSASSSNVARSRSKQRLILLASSHIVLTKDDHGQSLVLTGEDGGGGGGKGKGKGKGGGNERVVISGQGMGGGGNSNMVMQDAGDRDGDVVINGNSMIVPGEDGHIVLADTRSNQQQQRRSGPPPNLWAFWMPFLRTRSAYNNPFFGVPFG